MRTFKIGIMTIMLPLTAFCQGTLVDTFFYSQSLGFDRNVDVYLPEGYDPDGSVDYPAVYFLHGAGGNNDSYSEIISILDTLIENRDIDPVIVVKPGGHIEPYAGSMYTNSELYGAFEDFIVFDLVEFIEANFRVVPERGKRCIMGHSMGGIGSMKLALKHPDIYGGIASLSGALDLNAGIDLWIPHILSENGGSPPYNYSPLAGIFSVLAYTAAGAFSPDLNNLPFLVDFPLDSNGQLIDSIFALWRGHNPANLASSLPPDPSLSIYFDCGTLDYLEFYPMNTAFAETLASLEIPYEFQTFVGDHYSAARLPIALIFLDSILNSPTKISGVTSALPGGVSLLQNYPNPFNARTTIQYALPEARPVKIEIYDLLGRRVGLLVDEFKPAGYYRFIWNARDLATGIYFFKIQAREYSESKKMILLK